MILPLGDFPSPAQNSLHSSKLLLISQFEKIFMVQLFFSDPKSAIKYSKSEFWYGQQAHPLSKNSIAYSQPKHSVTAENINKRDRPKSAQVERSSEKELSIPRFSTPAAKQSFQGVFEYDRYKRPIVERGLVMERAKVRFFLIFFS